MWPGFGDNLRVLEWIMKRCFDEVDAVESPIGWLPNPEDINLEDSGVDIQVLKELLTVDKELWKEDAAGVHEFYARFGDKLPQELAHQLQVLEDNLK